MLREARRLWYHHFVLVDSAIDEGEGEGEKDEDGKDEDGGREGRVSVRMGKTCDWAKARALVDRGEIVVDPTPVKNTERESPNEKGPLPLPTPCIYLSRCMNVTVISAPIKMYTHTYGPEPTTRTRPRLASR
jgi:hypothetical protein